MFIAKQKLRILTTFDTKCTRWCDVSNFQWSTY